jgi:hypothetical protein
VLNGDATYQTDARGFPMTCNPAPNSDRMRIVSAIGKGDRVTRGERMAGPQWFTDG